MRRGLVVLTLVALMIGALAPAVLAGEISYSPISGTLSTVFTMEGEGFEPGTQIDLLITTPDGQSLELKKDGEPMVVVVGVDGQFTLQIMPARDLPGARPGTFRFTFLDLSQGEVYIAEIEVAA